jgi:hypothetical protein
MKEKITQHQYNMLTQIVGKFILLNNRLMEVQADLSTEEVIKKKWYSSKYFSINEYYADNLKIYGVNKKLGYVGYNEGLSGYTYEDLYQGRANFLQLKEHLDKFGYKIIVS